MSNRLASFASLHWYDAFIEFLFKLAAKTSEPLLAVGIVYSAAGVLSHGHLGYGNISVQNAWAITQALAIESSGGVVLVYGLQSLMEKDFIKAWCYLPLSFLLALVGGVMLFMQMTGMDATQGNSPFLLALFGLRCLVSVGYIYLCRTKHIRFSGLHLQQDGLHVNTLARDDMQAILSALGELQTLRQVVTELQASQPMLDGPEKPVRGDVQDVQGIDTTVELPPVETLQKPCIPIQSLPASDAKKNYGDAIAKLLEAEPDLTVREIADRVGCSIRTANLWQQRIQGEK